MYEKGWGDLRKKTPLWGRYRYFLELHTDSMIQTWFVKPLICRVTTFALLFKFPRKKDCDVPLFKEK